MGGRRLTPEVPGTITIVPMADGRYRCKARMKMYDRTRRDPVTGAYLPSDVTKDIMATVTDRRDAAKAIAAKAKEMIAEAKEEARATVAAAKAEATVTVYDAALPILKTAGETGELSEQTRYNYEGFTRRHLKGSALGSMAIAEVQPSDVQDWLAGLVAKMVPATAQTGRAVVRHVMRRSVMSGLIVVDPSAGVAIPQSKRGEKKRKSRLAHLDRKRALTEAERVQLAWSVARDERATDKDVRDIILLDLAAGLRAGELVALRYCDVTFTETGARLAITGNVKRNPGGGIVRGALKTSGSQRTVPVPRRIAALIRRRARAAGLSPEELATSELPIFPQPQAGGWRDPSNTPKDYRRAFDTAGLPWASSHSLRRTVATRLIDEVGIRQAADMLGHASVTTTLASYAGRAPVPDDVASYL